IEHRPAHDAVYYAYFAPYSLERHRDLVARTAVDPRARLEVLGQTVDGRDLDLLRIGAPSDDGKLIAWVIARQHPGESMAEWFMEGFMDRLRDEADPLSRALLDDVVFYCVPNMNPDGSRRGHLRNNAAGANLNREWAEPSLERSPEVYLVRERMRQTGVHFCLDVHGDEALPYNFIAGPDGMADLPPHVLAGRDAYAEALKRSSPDFQTEHGYPRMPPGKGNPKMATNHVAAHFGAVSLTFEQPFKDNADLPDETYGWSPARCDRLGRAQLDALYAILPLLRDAARG
ncbi:MAG: carboxypeptidase family protein, partial [Myxococcota bacterium]